MTIKGPVASDDWCLMPGAGCLVLGFTRQQATVNQQPF